MVIYTLAGRSARFIRTPLHTLTRFQGTAIGCGALPADLVTDSQQGVPHAAERVLLWIVCGFMGLNTLANLAARHPAERFGMGAVSLTLAVLMGHLALNLG